MFNQMICLEPSCQLNRVIDNANQISLHTKDKHQCVETFDLKKRLNGIANINLVQGKTLQIVIEEIIRPFIDQLKDALRSHIQYYLEQAIPNFKILQFSIDPHFDYTKLSNKDFQNMFKLYNNNTKIDVKQKFEQGLKDISQKQKEFCQSFIQNLKPIFIDCNPAELERQLNTFAIDETPTQKPESPKNNSCDQLPADDFSEILNVFIDGVQIDPQNISILYKFEKQNNKNNGIQYLKDSTQVYYKGAEQQVCLVEGILNQNRKIKFQLQKPHFLVGIIDLSKGSPDDYQSQQGKYQIGLEGRLITENEVLETKLPIILGGIIQLEWNYSTQLLQIYAGKKKKSYQYKIPFDDSSKIRIAVWLQDGGQIEILRN